jgi:hypothetical protein
MLPPDRESLKWAGDKLDQSVSLKIPAAVDEDICSS